jgi:predicted transposase YbfD/YdcC
MPVKENQPTLRADIEALLQQAARRADQSATTTRDALCQRQRLRVVGDRGVTQWPQLRGAETHNLGHGRIEHRRIEVLTVPSQARWLDWPGQQQVFRIQRVVIFKKSGQRRTQEVCGITSLSAAEADPTQLLELCRGHWGIENRSHWVRDVTFAEDAALVRKGHTPQVLAALRNTVSGLMRLAGQTNLAAACRYYAAKPWEALALLGLAPTFK